MPFATAQLKKLTAKLARDHIRTREQRGATLSYIEGWYAIAEANRIFGFDGWDRETVSSECVWQDGKGAPKACSYVARVRIRVRAGKTEVLRDGSGFGQATGQTLGEAHENALKEAETDATKRALTTFGNQFGLALYDPQQEGVESSKSSQPVLWSLWSINREPPVHYAEPSSFCSGLRAALKRMTMTGDLAKLWQLNALNIMQLRTVWPPLIARNGSHYADLLEKLYRERAEELKGAEALTGTGIIEKSALAIPSPKRIRDQHHLRFIGSLPCLICGRFPTEAHHLRFLQPRAMGKKASDEWTVPLCFLHHRVLHDVGDELQWWNEHRIDPKAEAERQWGESHASQQPDPPVLNLAADKPGQAPDGEH
jgi:DNA recombination protein Rad52